MINKLKFKKGFTLIETIIYIALFGLIMTGALLGTYNLIDGGKINIDISKIEEEGTFLNRKINWVLTGASNVVVSDGGTTITITRPDLGTQNPITISQSGNNMTISRGTSSKTELNNDRLKISDTNFIYTPAIGGRPSSISITFKVEEKTFNFRNYLRQ